MEQRSGTSILAEKAEIKLRAVRGYICYPSLFDELGVFIGTKSSARLMAIDELRAKSSLKFYSLILAE